MRQFDTRFPVKADPDLVEQLEALPVGSAARIRAVEFTKSSGTRWRNDFREDMTSAQVASVLVEGAYELQPA